MSVITADMSTAPEQQPARPEQDLPSLDAGAALPKVLKIVATIVAPTTLLTALLIYFGRLHVYGFFSHFGVNFTALDLSTQDFVIRSADGLFVPLAIVASAACLLVWLHRLVLSQLPRETLVRVLLALTPAAGIVGSVLVGAATVGVLDPDAFARYPEIPGLCLAIGVLLLLYAARLLRTLLAARSGAAGAATTSEAVAVLEWGAVFILVSVGLFWAVGNYAVGVGTGRAHQQQATLASWPDAIVYSERSLSLTAPGVREIACTNADAAYRFRYDGLKLVMQSGDQYFFVPAAWSRENGSALLIPRSDSLRLEFVVPGSTHAPQHESC